MEISYLFAAPLVFAGLLGTILISLRICVARVLSFWSSFTGPGALSVPWSDIFSTIDLEIKTVKGLRWLQTGPEKLLYYTKGAVFCSGYLRSHIKHSGCPQNGCQLETILICFVLEEISWSRLYKSENRMFKILSRCTFDKGKMSQSPKKLGKKYTGMGLKWIEYRM